MTIHISIIASDVVNFDTHPFKKITVKSKESFSNKFRHGHRVIFIVIAMQFKFTDHILI